MILSLGLLGALGLGVAFGYVAQRGAFCMNSGFRVVVTDRDFTKVKAFGLAIAVPMVLVPLLFAAGLSQATLPAFYPLGAVLGGVLFGLSMRWAGGCAAGIWYKTGAGGGGSLAAVGGMVVGATVLELGPLRGLRGALQGVGRPTQGVDLTSLLGIPSWALLLPLGLVLIVLLWRARPGTAGAWSWRRTGLLVGLIGAAAWPLSSLAARDFGLAVVPGSVATLAGVAGLPLATLRWDLVLVLGIPLGGYLAARRSGPVRVTGADGPALTRSAVGGLGLGVGASLAAGCTVGHGLAGVSLLAPGSLVATGAIVGGSTIATIWAGRHTRAAACTLPEAASR